MRIVDLTSRPSLGCNPAEEFSCGPGGPCVSKADVCDGQKQCPGGQDELSCPCKEEEKRCVADNFCLTPAQICNDVVDCSDEEDEKGCPCKSSEMTCSVDGSCVADTSRCDGTADCPDGEDERGCIPSECTTVVIARAGHVEQVSSLLCSLWSRPVPVSPRRAVRDQV